MCQTSVSHIMSPLKFITALDMGYHLLFTDEGNEV